ncbi:MAG: hypothetical protein AAF734_00555 [Bacteroidota bacterium]
MITANIESFCVLGEGSTIEISQVSPVGQYRLFVVYGGNLLIEQSINFQASTVERLQVQGTGSYSVILRRLSEVVEAGPVIFGTTLMLRGLDSVRAGDLVYFGKDRYFNDYLSREVRSVSLSGGSRFLNLSAPPPYPQPNGKFLVTAQEPEDFVSVLEIDCYSEGTNLITAFVPSLMIPLANGISFTVAKKENCNTSLPVLYCYDQLITIEDVSLLQIRSSYQQNTLRIYQSHCGSSNASSDVSSRLEDKYSEDRPQGNLIEEITAEISSSDQPVLRQNLALIEASILRLEGATTSPLEEGDWIKITFRKVFQGRPLAPRFFTFYKQITTKTVANNQVDHTLATTLYAGKNMEIEMVERLPHPLRYYSFKIDWKGYNCGHYRLEIVGKGLYAERTDNDSGLLRTVPVSTPIEEVHQSVPIHLQTHHHGTLKIAYTNDNNSFGMHYLDGLHHFVRVRAELGRNQQIETEREVYLQANGKRKKLYEALSRKLLLRIGRVPHYMHEKIQLALAHDVLQINEQLLTAEEEYAQGETSRKGLSSAEVTLTDNSFFEENAP